VGLVRRAFKSRGCRFGALVAGNLNTLGIEEGFGLENFDGTGFEGEEDVFLSILEGEFLKGFILLIISFVMFAEFISEFLVLFFVVKD